MLQFARSVVNAMIDSIVTESPVTTGASPAKVHLYTNDVDPNIDSVLTDFTEATFTGSAAKALGASTTGRLYKDPLNGEHVLECPQPLNGITFVCTVTPGAPETVRGYYLTDSAGTGYLGGEKFDTPRTINLAGQGIDIPTIEARLTDEVFKAA